MQMITADRRAFARALELATSVAEKRSTVPILEAVNIVANGALRFEATDLDTHATVEIAYAGEAIPPFALRVPHRVAAALRQIDEDDVTIGAPVEKRVRIASGALDTTIAFYPSEDFPDPVPLAHEEFTVDIGAGELAQIARVMPAISTEETRYYLNGICVDRIDEWTYRFVATDGHRLFMADIPLPGAVGAIPDRTIIPRRFLLTVLKHFAKAKDPARLIWGRRLLENKPDSSLAPEPGGAPLVRVAGLVGAARVALTSKLIDGTYPDYTRVIPREFTHTLRASRAALMRGLRGVTAFNSDKFRAVKLEAVDGGLRISLHSVDLGDAAIVVPAEHGLESETLICGFNGQYLMDALAALRGDEVQFDFNASGDPVAIHDPSDTAFRVVQMPMRV